MNNTSHPKLAAMAGKPEDARYLSSSDRDHDGRLKQSTHNIQAEARIKRSHVFMKRKPGSKTGIVPMKRYTSKIQTGSTNTGKFSEERATPATKLRQKRTRM